MTEDRKKSRFGDLEIYLVNGAGHKGNVLTINDRMTGFCILEPLPTKDSGLLAETLVCALAPYRDLLHTVTSDNGKEFAPIARLQRRSTSATISPGHITRGNAAQTRI